MADLSMYWTTGPREQDALQALSEAAHSPRCGVANQRPGFEPKIWASDLPIWQAFARVLLSEVSLDTLTLYKRYVCEFYAAETGPIRSCDKEDLERYEGLLVQSRQLESVKARMAVIEQYWSFAQAWEPGSEGAQ